MASERGRGAQARLDEQARQLARGGSGLSLLDASRTKAAIERAGTAPDGLTPDGSLGDGTAADDEVFLPGGLASGVGNGGGTFDPAPINAAVAAEATARAAAVTAEANARIAADAAEVTARTAAITAEANARTAADTAEVSARVAAVAAESNARTAALTAEATARTAAIAPVSSAAAAAQAAAAAAQSTASAASSEVAALKASGGIAIDMNTIPRFANDAAALAGGLAVGRLYLNGSVLQVVASTPTVPNTPTRSPVITGAIANAILGAAASVTVTGLLANETFTYSVITNNPPTYTPRSSPFLTATANGSGSASISPVFVATGDFLQLKFTNPTLQVNSVSVATTSTSTNGTSTTLRGRPVISGGTILTDINTRMRGGTMALDEIGSLASTYAKNRANWTLFRNQGLNMVRLPFSLSYVGVSLAAQMAEMDVCVANAAATGMYVMPMFDWDYGQSNYPEMLSAWPTIAARYKDNTNVIFEMQNEPHWDAGEHTNAELNSIAQVYTAMRSAAPNTLIGVLTPASVETSTGILSAASQLVTKGVDIGTKAFVTFHAYGSYSRTAIQQLKAARPCMLTETTSGGPSNNGNPNNEVFILSEMETVGVSWQMLPARFGEVSNTDTPYSNDQTTMTQRVLPGLKSAGVTWTQDPLSQTPAQQPGTPAVTSLTGNVAGGVVGSPITMSGTATGTSTVNWVIVASNFVWRGDGTAQAAVTGGNFTFAWTPVAAGDFVKVWPTAASGNTVDSAAVPQPTTGGGGTLPQPNSASFREDFSNNNGGALNHTWGNTRAISYTGGIMRIAAVPGSPGDSGAAGVMQFPGSASGGFGYGFFEQRVKFFGAGPGPCGLLWAADDSWPRGEEDMGELVDVWYCAHHYDAGGGQNAYETFTYKDAFPARGDLKRGQWVTVGCLIKPGYLEYFVDTGAGHESIGSTTNNVTPMFSDGGVNRVHGIMHRGDRTDTAIECDWVQWTAL